RIPTHATPLKQFVKANDGDAIWYIQNGVRKLIPSYNNFLLLGASMTQVDILGGTALNSIPVSGIKLATGTLVKTSSGPSVYVINGSSRILYSSSTNFVGYSNNWNDIETYPVATLDAAYPAAGTNIQQYYYDGANTDYVINEQACYAIPTSSLPAYGLNQTTIANNQTYAGGVFPHFNTGSCHAATTYVKSPNSAQVYWIDGGQKHVFTSWSQLTAKAHTENPDIMTIDSAALGSIPTGSSVQ
ncbi:MAG TPA: hypothetical protein VGO07_05525, partial [Candidatus Saccharimonadales bacterium]|nr:hypothetical protein [Candidatus Saccharimonadales bacterium]